MHIENGSYLKAGSGWTEVTRDDDMEIAVVRAETSGYLRLVAIVGEEDRDLGDYFTITDEYRAAGASGKTDAELAAEMMAA